MRQDIDALPGLHVLREEFLGAETSHDLDPLHVVIDVADLGVTGYDAADWLRENHRLDIGLSDHRRMEATLSLADDDQTAARLMSALTDLTKQAGTLPPAHQVELPSAAELELEPAMLPRATYGPHWVNEFDSSSRPGCRSSLPGQTQVNLRVPSAAPRSTAALTRAKMAPCRAPRAGLPAILVARRWPSVPQRRDRHARFCVPRTVRVTSAVMVLFSCSR